MTAVLYPARQHRLLGAWLLTFRGGQFYMHGETNTFMAAGVLQSGVAKVKFLVYHHLPCSHQRVDLRIIRINSSSLTSPSSSLSASRIIS